MVLLIVLLAELIYSRLAPPRVPHLPVAWATARAVHRAGGGRVLVVRMLVHLGDFGWGFYPVMGAAMVLA